MAVQTEIHEFRARELRRAEERLTAARDYLATTEARYRSGERVEDRSGFGAIAVTRSDVGKAEARVAAAASVVEAWLMLIKQAGDETRLRAITRIQFSGRGIEPGEIFDVPDDELPSIVQLIEGGAAAIAEPAPEPSDAAKLGSTELRKRLAIIDERRQRRREALAEAEAALTEAETALRDLQIAQELDGEKVQAGAIAKAEARVSEAERNVKAKRAAFGVEIERTAADHETYSVALPEASAAETAAGLQARVDELYGRVYAARRRTLTSAIAFHNAIADEKDLVQEMRTAKAELSRQSGTISIGELRVIEPDGGYGTKFMDGVIGQLASDPLTKLAGGPDFHLTEHGRFELDGSSAT